MKTFVTITQQMLDGELTINEAAEEILQIPPAVPHYDYDGMYYEGNEDNTLNAMLALGMDRSTRKMNEEVEQRIEELIDVIESMEEENEMKEKKTFVTITRQMLDGELSIDEAAEEMLPLTPAKAVYDYDGMYYEGEEDNTFSSMMVLDMDKETGMIDPEIRQQIRNLIRAFRDKRKAQ